MPIDPDRMASALASIRAATGDVTEVIDAWQSHTDDTVQLFVSVAQGAVERGQSYVTWVVTQTPDGTFLALDHFPSVACRPSSTKT